jgi:Protein of unknown function (DUF3592)
VILEIAGLLLFLFVAGFLLYPMFRSSKRQATQRRWPRVRGEVVEQRVRMEGSTGLITYRVRYAVDGRSYEEYAGAPDGLGYTNYDIEYDVRRALDAKVARHPVGSQIELMVDPSNHAAVFFLERQLPARALAYIVSAVFLVFLIVFVVIAFDLI